MDVTNDIAGARAIRQRYGRISLGLVPTMGFLHEGHLTLIRRARADNDHVAVSIYVNPKQFGPAEDLSRYPRDLDRDLALLEAEDVDLVFVPDDAIMYPPDHQTTVSVTKVTQPLEGERRPTHFEGVATVVAKLFNIVRPSRAYFGQKDAQQTVVIRQMIRDLNFDIEIVVCPTVREPDGLAMSSRNKYLTAEQRLAAGVLYCSLKAAEALWLGGVHDGQALRQAMLDVLSAEEFAHVDYVSAADTATLMEWEGEIAPDKAALLSLAVFFGRTRLIDNLILR